MKDIEAVADPLETQLARSERILDWLYPASQGIKAPRTPKNIIAGSALQLAMDHHKAIYQLANDGMPASALALLRPLVEAYTFGAWINHCAEEVPIKQFLDRKFSRKLEQMQRDLTRGWDVDAIFKGRMAVAVKNMHGYTHGGIEQLQWRLKGDEVRPGYPNDLIVGLLIFADMHGYLALQATLALGENEEAANALHAGVNEMFG